MNQGVQEQHGTFFLGRYRVVDEIGIGGMASVFLARMDGPGGFQRWVAIKRIHPHLIEDESFVHMFLDEARIAASISHPNVATVFDLGKTGDSYWIAMEYLHGEPLREIIRRNDELRRPIPPEIAAKITSDAAEGLHSAHELTGKNGEKLNLVHRDVTPHNIFIAYDGNVKVVDFGIAKFSSRMAHTRTGTLKGKLAYMSPEQVVGEPIDRRTDVFALGVVLWEITTGQRLFRMDNDLETMAKVQECVIPRPSSIVRGYPPELEKIVLKALSKNKDDRFATARDFSRALVEMLMRRGHIVGNEEIKHYMFSVFQERIRDREEHLRWAADVTQTVSIEAVAASPVESMRFPIATNENRAMSGRDLLAPPPPKGIPIPTAFETSRGVRKQLGIPTGGPINVIAPNMLGALPSFDRKTGGTATAVSSDGNYEDPTDRGTPMEDLDATQRAAEGFGVGGATPSFGVPSTISLDAIPVLDGDETGALPTNVLRKPISHGALHDALEPPTWRAPERVGALEGQASFGPAAPAQMPPPQKKASKEIPLWAVAVGSGLVALAFVFTLFFLLVPKKDKRADNEKSLPQSENAYVQAQLAFDRAIAPMPTVSSAAPHEHPSAIPAHVPTPDPSATTPLPSATAAPSATSAPTATASASTHSSTTNIVKQTQTTTVQPPVGKKIRLSVKAVCDSVTLNRKPLRPSPFEGQTVNVPAGQHSVGCIVGGAIKTKTVYLSAGDNNVGSF